MTASVINPAAPAAQAWMPALAVVSPKAAAASSKNPSGTNR